MHVFQLLENAQGRFGLSLPSSPRAGPPVSARRCCLIHFFIAETLLEQS